MSGIWDAHTRKDSEFLKVEVKLHVTATGADSWRSRGGGCSGLGGGRERRGFGWRLTGWGGRGAGRELSFLLQGGHFCAVSLTPRNNVMKLVTVLSSLDKKESCGLRRPGSTARKQSGDSTPVWSFQRGAALLSDRAGQTGLGPSTSRFAGGDQTS